MQMKPVHMKVGLREILFLCLAICLCSAVGYADVNTTPFTRVEGVVVVDGSPVLDQIGEDMYPFVGDPPGTLSWLEYDPHPMIYAASDHGSDFDYDPESGYGSAFARATTDGWLWSNAHISLGNEDSMFFQGMAQARTVFTNTGLGQNFTMDFFVDRGTLGLDGVLTEGVLDVSGIAHPLYSELLLEIFINQSAEASWRSLNRLDADLETGVYQFTQENTPLPIFDMYQGDTFVVYDFDFYYGELDLGYLGMGESIEITYQISATAAGPSVPDSLSDYTGAYAFTGDPFNFTGEDVLQFRVSNSEVIPEPATMTLLGLGFAGLALRRFRKKPAIG